MSKKTNSTDKILAFFQKKFNNKPKGQGHRLNEPPQPSIPSSSKSKKKDVYIPPNRQGPNNAARAAAEAAMSRIDRQEPREFNTSLAAIKAQVRRELEAEKKAKEEGNKKSEIVLEDEDTTRYAVKGVYFRCPLINDEILPRQEWKIKIKEFLYEQLEHERGLTASLIIQNCNTIEKAEMCKETLCKYLENILNNHNEEKYKKIRMSNRVFNDKVRYIEGAIDLLVAAGFIEQTIDDELYMVWMPHDEAASLEIIKTLLEALKYTEKINLELDRNIQVLLPSQANRNVLPPDFYRITQEELKREQKLRSETAENQLVLKTKAMRDREEQRVMSRYKYSLIRIRFPNGVYLQGTFNIYEKLLHVYEFVQSCLSNESSEYVLTSPTGHRFENVDVDKSLMELRLVPNIVLNFFYDNSAPSEIFLKDELMMLIRQM